MIRADEVGGSGVFPYSEALARRPEVRGRFRLSWVRRSRRPADVEVIDLSQDFATPYLTEEGDPVLAALWDNDDDAVYDPM